jgi:hypothetical protein
VHEARPLDLGRGESGYRLAFGVAAVSPDRQGGNGGNLSPERESFNRREGYEQIATGRLAAAYIPANCLMQTIEQSRPWIRSASAMASSTLAVGMKPTCRGTAGSSAPATNTRAA